MSVFGTKWHDFSNKYIADPKADRLEISEPGLRFVVIYMRTVGTQTGTRISGLGPATETKSDRSEFIVRSVSCKRVKRNVWSSIRTHAGVSSVPVSCNYPIRFQGEVKIFFNSRISFPWHNVNSLALEIYGLFKMVFDCLWVVGDVFWGGCRCLLNFLRWL